MLAGIVFVPPIRFGGIFLSFFRDILGIMYKTACLLNDGMGDYLR
jgi:hypothetical protein